MLPFAGPILFTTLLGLNFQSLKNMVHCFFKTELKNYFVKITSLLVNMHRDTWFRDFCRKIFSGHFQNHFYHGINDATLIFLSATAMASKILVFWWRSMFERTKSKRTSHRSVSCKNCYKKTI